MVNCDCVKEILNKSLYCMEIMWLIFFSLIFRLVNFLNFWFLKLWYNCDLDMKIIFVIFLKIYYVWNLKMRVVIEWLGE